MAVRAAWLLSVCPSISFVTGYFKPRQSADVKAQTRHSCPVAPRVIAYFDQRVRVRKIDANGPLTLVHGCAAEFEA